ncbi:UNVERIFIED_CONTAM: AraC family transcriptional regulator [Streptococcus canis]|uniref:AraC family transcriptional regulator n=3 Tax=Streptococcus canis TaxID=1329 RepID=A0A2D4DML6_STRCB|nr:AraC family transcriptional regulator [Streptococcus canis]EIQ81039.1 transcriptional regulator [Streptococcus canis FSL Z3-227]MDV5972563.1 AraC family transcriptional regulator [Streptococcus canis]MDV5976610.1 AraC family transcriptional regulator [Streptococcus canis]MDV5987533.1 AraC family transcriptional regulator [Streptococcus canis]MDV5993410.1 AraC family transcriptional regulator [Streptococcus canis]
MLNTEFHIFNNQSYIDFYPIQFGQESCQPLHSFGPAMKKHYLFHYIIEGQGTFYISGQDKAYHLKAGQGFLIPPDLICSYEADKDNPWSYMWIEFDGLKSQHFLRLAGMSALQPIFSQHTTSKDSAVYQELTALMKSYHKNSAHIIAHLYLFIDALIKNSLTHYQTEHDDIKVLYIREAVNFIERNYDKPITVTDMARHCNLNKHYFSRLFKEQVYTSPQQFLIQYRLSKACELLRTTNLNLQEVAEQVGYSNQFNFSTAFKRHYQQSPNVWRKEHKKTIS